MKKSTYSKKSHKQRKKISKKKFSILQSLSTTHLLASCLFIVVIIGLFFLNNFQQAKALGLVQVIHTSQWQPPSPDPAGIAFNPLTGQLMIVDSEVEEMPLYANRNLFISSLAGNSQDGYTTTGFSSEPSDIAINPANGHWFISDDDVKKIFEVDIGPDSLFGTEDDIRTSFSTLDFGNNDPEGITFGDGKLFITSGEGKRVYILSPGANGIFEGIYPTSDDQVTSFDTTILKMNDPEGIAYNTDTGSLFLVSWNYKTRVVEASTTGALIRNINVTELQAIAFAGIEYAPSSNNPSERSLYIVDRGIDNNVDPAENDGRLYEFSLGTQTASPTPLPTNTPIVESTSTPTPTSEPTSTPLPTLTPSVTQLTLTPIADAYVDASKPTSKYGSATRIYDDGSPIMITYFKFNLAQLAGKTIESATLRFKVYNPSIGTHLIKEVQNSAWIESTINYNNRPLLGNQLASFNNAPLAAWIEVDVTPFTISKIGQLMSLGMETSHTDSLGIYSKENTTDKPQLFVRYQ